MKISTKILLNIFVSILITGIIAILISRTISKNIIEDEIKNNTANVALSNSLYIKSIIENYEKITVALVVGNFTKDIFDPEQDREKALKWAKKRINNTILSIEKISRIRVLNDKGIVIVSSHEDTGEDDSKKDVFIEAKKGIYLGDIHVSRFTGNLVMSISSPVFVNNVFSGVIVINFDVKDELYKILENRIGLGTTGEIYLLNKEGLMITPLRFVDNVILKQKVDIVHDKKCVYVFPDLKIKRTQVYFGEYKNYMDQNVFRVHTHIPEVDWDLVVDINTEEIFAPVSKLTNSLLLILLILLLTGVIVAFIISRTITKPIIKLHKGIEEIEKGNLDYKVGIKTKDEIGQLSRAFDKMTGNLKILKEKLEKHSLELEEKVKESEQQKHATLNILQDVDETNIKLKQALVKATESDRLKTAFLNTMSHELRTPLNAVIGFSDIINKDTSIDEILDYSKTINYSGNHLLEIVEDIFDIMMIESGEVEIQKEEFNLTAFMDVIHKILKAEQEETDKQHIDIYFKPVEKAKDFLVYTDKSNLKRILINLLKNALKFTHEGNIEYGYMKETQQEDPVLKFYVKDTGIGISENKLDIIFKIFRQADDTDTRLYGGTGIGLSVSKKLTELLGGKIWVETEEGNLPAGKAGGSTFYFTIPYRKAEII